MEGCMLVESPSAVEDLIGPNELYFRIFVDTEITLSKNNSAVSWQVTWSNKEVPSFSSMLCD